MYPSTFVNLRSESYSKMDSRIPTHVQIGTPLQDALRRDFTINTLFYNINRDVVEDMTGCVLRDLSLQIIRTPLIPLQTFLDDPLRILRGIRFASRYHFGHDHDLSEVISTNELVRQALITKISRERIGHELEEMVHNHCIIPIKHAMLAFTNIERTRLYQLLFRHNIPDSLCYPFSSFKLCLSHIRYFYHPRVISTFFKLLTQLHIEEYIHHICRCSVTVDGHVDISMSHLL